jgi:hypothetical protein
MTTFEIWQKSAFGWQMFGTGEGETAADALEHWRLQNPYYWNKVDIANGTINGYPILIQVAKERSKIQFCIPGGGQEP